MRRCGAAAIMGTVLEPPPPASPNFSAVLLAGGNSTRMGRDKAALLIDGRPLWQRQLATLRATAPVELFISGKPDGPYAADGVPIIADAIPGLGPLAGLAAALRHARQARLLVLAIDLPAITAPFLGKLLAGAPAVPRRDGRFEPLAAVYPSACRPLVEECLRESDRSMQRFVRLALEHRLLRIHDLDADEAALFRNVNTPADC